MSARAEMIAHYKAVRERMQPRPQLKVVEASPSPPAEPVEPSIVFIEDKSIDLSFLKRRIRMNDILFAVASHYELSLIDLASERRTKKLARARQMAFCVARELTLNSYPQMAAALNKDHTTALYADHITRERMQSDQTLREDFETICRTVREAKEKKDG